MLWTELMVTDAEGETRRLVEMVRAGEANGLQVSADGSAEWDGHFLHSASEPVNWAGFATVEWGPGSARMACKVPAVGRQVPGGNNTRWQFESEAQVADFLATVRGPWRVAV